jgi:uncharacterized membrane protein
VRLLQQLRLRPRLLLALALGASVALWPMPMALPTRALLGWNLGAWVYLGLVLHLLLRGSAQDLQARARSHADGSGIILGIAILGAAASLGAIVFELGRGSDAASALVVATVAVSWLLLPLEFALAYASLYHARRNGSHGLEFPGDGSLPDFSDFLYFAVTLAATSQTSDVTISSRAMRRLVLLHATVSFLFNTTVLALLINILAGMVR